ncbi:MAG: HTTM domain-containing protein [Saprospiraceae bacterium]|nr:HTTM domain-containing protein [Saprospiraceae bacterium]
MATVTDTAVRHRLKGWWAGLDEPVSIAPLVTLRVVLGGLLLFSTARFWALGWIDDHYIRPGFHFHYYGFEWVRLLPPSGLYAVHALLMLSSLLVMLGLCYRLAALAQFLLFTYTELLDLTYYLNHYYFVSIACAMLVVAPAHRAVSLDVWRNPALRLTHVPRWTVGMFKLQLALVYGYAGLWKINSDWLLHALPLKIWLPAQDRLPLIGPLFRFTETAYVFSWLGMLYDATIPFWLSWSTTRPFAYVVVIVFHVVTGMLFQIGVFPAVMIGATLVFFSEKWHRRIWRIPNGESHAANTEWRMPIAKSVLVVHFLFQILFPWRYLLYPGNVFWTEEGYRFSWRVMLMEKAGTAQFYVRDGRTGREGLVVNSEFLNPHQEKQMSMQPDMILQFAHFLKAHYEKKGVADPVVRAEVYVTLNGRPSRLLIDPAVDLTLLRDGWGRKAWILASER